MNVNSSLGSQSNQFSAEADHQQADPSDHQQADPSVWGRQLEVHTDSAPLIGKTFRCQSKQVDNEINTHLNSVQNNVAKAGAREGMCARYTDQSDGSYNSGSQIHTLSEDNISINSTPHYCREKFFWDCSKKEQENIDGFKIFIRQAPVEVIKDSLKDGNVIAEEGCALKESFTSTSLSLMHRLVSSSIYDKELFQILLDKLGCEYIFEQASELMDHRKWEPIMLDCITNNYAFFEVLGASEKSERLQQIIKSCGTLKLTGYFRINDEYAYKRMQQWYFNELTQENLFQLLCSLFDKMRAWKKIFKHGGFSVTESIFKKLNDVQVRQLFLPSESKSKQGENRADKESILTILLESHCDFEEKIKQLELLIKRFKEMGICEEVLVYGSENGGLILHSILFENRIPYHEKESFFDFIVSKMGSEKVCNLFLMGLSSGHSLFNTAINQNCSDGFEFRQFVKVASPDQVGKMFHELSLNLKDKEEAKQVWEAMKTSYYKYILALPAGQINDMSLEDGTKAIKSLMVLFDCICNISSYKEKISFFNVEIGKAEDVWQLLEKTCGRGSLMLGCMLDLCLLKQNSFDVSILLWKYNVRYGQDGLEQWLIGKPAVAVRGGVFEKFIFTAKQFIGFFTSDSAASGCDQKAPLNKILDRALTNWALWEAVNPFLKDDSHDALKCYISNWFISPRGKKGEIPLNYCLDGVKGQQEEKFLQYINNKDLECFLLSLRPSEQQSSYNNACFLESNILKKVIAKLKVSKGVRENNKQANESIIKVLKGVNGESLLHFIFRDGFWEKGYEIFDILVEEGLLVDLLAVTAKKDGLMPLDRLFEIYNADSADSYSYMVQDVIVMILKGLFKKGVVPTDVLSIRNKKNETFLKLISTADIFWYVLYEIDASLMYQLARFKDKDGGTIWKYLYFSLSDAYSESSVLPQQQSHLKTVAKVVSSMVEKFNSGAEELGFSDVKDHLLNLRDNQGCTAYRYLHKLYKHLEPGHEVFKANPEDYPGFLKLMDVVKPTDDDAFNSFTTSRSRQGRKGKCCFVV